MRDVANAVGGAGDRRRGQGLGVGQTPRGRDDVPVPVVVEDAPAGHSAGFLGGLHHLAEGQPGVFEAEGVGEDLYLARLAADDRDVCDAAEAHQTRPDFPVGEGAKLPRIQRIRLQRQQHDLPHNRGHRGKRGRIHPRRQLRPHLGQALVHQRARTEAIGVPREFRPNNRQARHRSRPNPAHPRRSIQRGFNEIRHPLLHIDSAQSVGLGHDGHRRRRQIRKDVDLHRPQHGRSRDHQRKRRAQHHIAVGQGIG